MSGKRVPIEVRYWPKVDVRGLDECWPWLAARQKSGHGVFGRGGGGMTGAHRVAWLLAYGPVPEGMEVCHTCDNGWCQNPAHLWLGTHEDNMRDRDRKGRQITNGNERKTHCPQGHPYDEVNTYRHKKGRGCRACQRVRQERWRQAHL